jgi:hypothetical protein
LIRIFIDFAILAKVIILVEPKFLIGNSVSILNLVIEISVPIGSTMFLVMDLMDEISVLVGSSPFLV